MEGHSENKYYANKDGNKLKGGKIRPEWQNQQNDVTDEAREKLTRTSG